MKKFAPIFVLLVTVLGISYFTFFRSQRIDFSSKGCYARIPIEFIGDNALINVEIEGKKYPVKLDLGADYEFSFFKETLDHILQKQFIDIATTVDIKGNFYKSNSYLIPLIKAKNFKCKNTIVLEESKDFVTKGAKLWPLDEEKDSLIPFFGRIGRGCFEAHNLFIDFPNSMLFVTNELDQLIADHWSICDLFEIPFEINKWGIILSIETDLGTKRFILDTGANASILKSSHLPEKKRILTSMKFAINGQDFGPIDLFLFDLMPAINADGLLGLDFLQNYAIYFDFQNRKMLIGPSSKTCGAIIF